ncbi:MAG: OB-fold nucleic acid binding domain-containing protein [Candidatus Izemoplasmatales bacterium]|nr:OB-fold nucleic acid binding domain-containing protein [Candidatus Izemoplasmatales bacterium]
MLNEVTLAGRVRQIDRAAGIITLDIKRAKEDKYDLIPLSVKDDIMDLLDEIEVGMPIGVRAKIEIDDNIMRIKVEKVHYAMERKSA